MTGKNMEMTGAEMVLQAMRDNGVEHIFGYPGGAVLPIYDELHQQDTAPYTHLTRPTIHPVLSSARRAPLHKISVHSIRHDN